jgi:acetyltransferase-like isoleucine patch superfamily enzyme
MAYLRFLYGKIRGYSFATLLRLELESLLFGIFGWVPTTFGVLLRGAVFQLLSRRCKGFAWIQPHVVIVHADRIEIGRNFAVNSHTYLNGVGGLVIGDDVLIGSSVTISSGMHPIEGRESSVIARQSIPKPIIIEDDVWIGAGVVLVPGIRIRKGTVIGANSVVTRDTEEYAVMVGAPARKIRSR